MRSALKALLLPLLGHPFEVFAQYWVFPQSLKRIEFPRQRHFVVLAMDASVAQPADTDAGLQCFL